jgi:3-oxoacyl-[acyl-carrier protein] reductase
MARRCLVLGGSGYVGAEVCRVLAERGAKLAYTYFRNEVRHDGALGLRADLRDYAGTVQAVERAAQALGGIDVLVQCAGSAGDPALYQGKEIAQDRLRRIGESDWDEMMDLTVKGSFSACQAAARAMNAGGQIIIIGSMDGVKMVPSPAHYAAGKGALRAMVQALAKELGGRGILVNMLAPGILAGGVGKLLSDDLLQEYLKHCSLKRTGTAHEIAQFAAWLAMENTYVTGQAIVLDGGL